MIVLFVAADHVDASFLGGYLMSLLVLVILMTYYVLRGHTGMPTDRAGSLRYFHTTTHILRLASAFWFGVCLASAVGYAEQKQAFVPRDPEGVEYIDAVLIEPSVVYPTITILPLRVDRVHRGETILSSQGVVDCLYLEPMDIDAETKLYARVRLTHQDIARGAPDCFLTEIVTLDRPNTVVGRVAALRSRMVGRVRATLRLFPRSTVPLLQALFLGERAALNPVVALRFRTAGLPHLLALSGMHLAIITVISTLLLRAVMGVRGARIGTIVLIVFYVWIVGNKPSLNRAAIMLIMWNVLLLCNREIKPINILSYAFVVLSCRYPGIRTDLSFQLSFSALAGIMIIGRPIRQRLQHALPAILSQPLALTLAAQLTTLPLLIYHFGVWYPVGIIGSIVVTPLITLFMWSALFFVPFYYLPIEAVHFVIDRYMAVVYAIIQQGVYWFSKFPAYQL